VTRVVIAALAVGAVVFPGGRCSHLESRIATSAVLPPILGVADGKGLQPNASVSPRVRESGRRVDAVFQRNGEVVGVFVAYYRNQTQTREWSAKDRVVTTANPDWTQMREGIASAQSGSRVLEVREVELRHSHLRLDAWQWFWIGGRTSTSDFVAKAWLAWSRLMGHGDDSAAVVIYSPRTDSSVSVAPVLRRFVADMGDSIHESLQEARR
jgi:EpsI family protein